MTARLEPLFVDVAPGRESKVGRRFAIHHPPVAGTSRALVLYVHPFAEEMNKSRRMAALQARALAEQGCAVLQLDLLGCGDSAGEFGDATWEQWVNDVVAGAAWLRARHQRPHGSEPLPLWLWGLRAGALLAAAAAVRIEAPRHFVLWQPATSGKTVIQQFLRLAAASELLGGQARGVVGQLRAELDSDRRVEVAGYTLHPGLYRGLEGVRLAPPPGSGRLEWLELQRCEGAELSPAASATLAAWQAAGWRARATVASGPPFWQTTEVEDAPALVAATVTVLKDTGPAADSTPPARAMSGTEAEDLRA